MALPFGHAHCSLAQTRVIFSSALNVTVNTEKPMNNNVFYLIQLRTEYLIRRSEVRYCAKRNVFCCFRRTIFSYWAKFLLTFRNGRKSHLSTNDSSPRPTVQNNIVFQITEKYPPCQLTCCQYNMLRFCR